MRVAGALLLAALVGVSVVQATHFRFGTLSWVQEGGGNGRQFLFTIDTAWRRTFFNQGNFQVGQTLGEEAVFIPDSRRADQRTQFAMVVNVINQQADWFIAQQKVRFQFNDAGTTFASYQRCCRISTLVNNKDKDFKVQARVLIPNGGGSLVRSIVTTAIPIVTVIERELASFAIPATAPKQGDALRYRLSLGNEAISDQNAGQFEAVPGGLAVNYENGLITWVPPARGLYTTQITIEQYNRVPSGPNDKNGLETSTAVDFIISVIGTTDKRCKRFCSNKGNPCGADTECFDCRDDNPASTFYNPPMCDPNFPPRFTRIFTKSGTAPQNTIAINANPQVVQGTLGLPFTLTIEATDPDVEDRITITSTTLPSGSTPPQQVVRNPGTHSITWTLTEQIVICYSAIDDLLNPSLGQQCIRVEGAPAAMTASGDCLTRAVAGDACTFQISNIAGRTHRVAITSPVSTFSATVTATSAPGASSNTVTYNAVYSDLASNVNTYITRAGFYILNIQDTITTNPPPALFYNLQVRPSRTDPPSAVPSDVGSTGLIGGRSNQDLFFYVLSRDRFQNEILEQRTDSYYCVVQLTEPTVGAERTFPAGTFQSTGDASIINRHRLTYTVPTSSVDGKYKLSVFWRNTSTATTNPGPILAFTRTLVLQAVQFRAEIRTASSFVAGNPIIFYVEVFATDIKTLQVEVNGVPVPLKNTANAPTPGSIYYNYEAPAITKATAAASPALITLRSTGILNADSTGVVKANFAVIPGPPSPPDLLITGKGVDEVKAGENAQIAVQLVDKYLNDITSQFQDVFVTRVAKGVRPDGTPFETALPPLKLTYGRLGRYENFYVETVSGESNVTLTFADGTLLGKSSFSVTVEPAEFGITKSGFSFPQSIIAGDKGIATISAADRFENIRRGGDDSFRVQFLLKISDNDVFEGDADWQLVSGSRYAVTFNSTKAGLYNLVVRANVPNQGGFLLFRDNQVRVLPGPVVPENVGLSGQGLKGGVIGKPAQVVMQARDQYGNPVLKSGTDWFAIEVVGETGVSTYYKAEHVPGNIAKSNPALASFWSLQNTQQQALSPDEVLLQEEGYWRLNYVVPPANGKVKEFKINTYYADSSKITVDPNDPKAVIQAGEAQQVKSSVGTATSGATLRSPSDNWPIIAGSVFGAALVLSLGGYTYWRLQRYRPKYLLEKERAEEAERALREMAEEIDIIPGGRDFEAVGAATVSANPLHEAYQLKHKPKEELEMVDDPKDVKMEVSRPAIRKEFQPQRTGATGKFAP